MKIYKKVVVKNSLEALKKDFLLTQMTGAEIYRVHGYLEGETLFEKRADFDDGMLLKAVMVCGAENDYPQWSIILFAPDGREVCDVSENYDDDSLLGQFVAEDEKTNTVYCMELAIERCAIPIRYTGANEAESVTYCDSGWLTKHFQMSGDNLFRFLLDCTSDEAAGLIGDAILAGAIAFVLEEKADRPFNFPADEEWKYRAFADVLSEWLNKEHKDASKALDAFMNL